MYQSHPWFIPAGTFFRYYTVLETRFVCKIMYAYHEFLFNTGVGSMYAKGALWPPAYPAQ